MLESEIAHGFVVGIAVERALLAGIAAEASREESRKVQEAGDDPRALWALAMQLSAEAAAKQVAARRIIETLAPGEKPAPKEKEKAAETDGPKEKEKKK